MATTAAAVKEAPATKFAKDQLKAIIERIERLEEEKKTISDDIRDVYAEGKGNGFDVKALRQIVRLRKQDPNERAVLYINSAESMMALGRLEEAIAMYRRGIDAGQLALRSGFLQSQSQALHLLGLAVALDRDEQEEKALASARRAIELDPALSQLHDPHVFFVPDGDVLYYEAMRELAPE